MRSVFSRKSGSASRVTAATVAPASVIRATLIRVGRQKAKPACGGATSPRFAAAFEGFAQRGAVGFNQRKLAIGSHSYMWRLQQTHPPSLQVRRGLSGP